MNVRNINQAGTNPQDQVMMPEANPLQKALDDYHRMEQQLADARHDISELRIENGSLMAELAIRREQNEHLESDRVRLQAIASGLLGKLQAIQSVINDAVRTSINNGIEAGEAHYDKIAEVPQSARDEANAIADQIQN